MHKDTQRIFSAWLAGIRDGSKTISTDGQTIFSYQTPLLVRSAEGLIVLNVTKYTVTTSRHQATLKRLLDGAGMEYVAAEVDSDLFTGRKLDWGGVPRFDNNPAAYEHTVITQLLEVA